MSDILLPTSSVRRPRAASTPRDIATMTGRCLRIASRNVDAVITSLMLPVMMMLLFVYLFGGAIHTGGKYVTYVVPGVLLLCAGFGAGQTAVTISQDLTTGVVDRFRSMDVRGSALLVGHVAASLVRNAVSTAIVLGVALLIGFRPDATPIEWVAALGFVALFILAISTLAAALGLVARSAEAANGMTFFLMFLPYASSAFVPVETMPTWLHGFADHQPITPVIETIRGLLVGTPLGHQPAVAAAWCTGIIVVTVAASGALFARRSA